MMKPVVKPALALPVGAKKVSIDFYRLVTCVYGRPGIGKTTFAAGFPDVVLFSCERVSPAISAPDFNAENGGVRDWATFLEGVKLLEQNPKAYRTVVIDTIEALYQHCFRHVCKAKGIDHPQDEAYGKGWDAIKNEFVGGIDRLWATGRGVVFTAHAKEVENTTFSGEKYTRIQPAVGGPALAYLKAKTDCVFYLEYFRGQDGNPIRVAITEGDELVDAKHAGELPRFMPLRKDGGCELFARAYKGEAVGLTLDQIRTGKATGKAGAALVEGEKVKAAKARVAPRSPTK